MLNPPKRQVPVFCAANLRLASTIRPAAGSDSTCAALAGLVCASRGFWQFVVQRAIIVAAVGFDSYGKRLHKRPGRLLFSRRIDHFPTSGSAAAATLPAAAFETKQETSIGAPARE